MSDAYEQWRAADGKAHELELWIRSNAATNYPAELARAKQLRAEADKLFDAAIREMHAKVNSVLGAWPPRPGKQPTHTRF